MKAIVTIMCTLGLLLSFAHASFAHAAETPEQAPFVYTSSYEAGAWLGHVKAYAIGAGGSAGSPSWDAADLIPPWRMRHIGTTKGSTGSANASPSNGNSWTRRKERLWAPRKCWNI